MPTSIKACSTQVSDNLHVLSKKRRVRGDLGSPITQHSRFDITPYPFVLMQGWWDADTTNNLNYQQLLTLPLAQQSQNPTCTKGMRETTL